MVIQVEIQYGAKEEHIFFEDVLIKTNIDGKAVIHVVCNGNIVLNGKIDGQSTITLESTNGSITIGGKIDGQSKVKLKAYNGISIEGKIDGQSKVKLRSRSGQIFINGKIDGGSRTIVYHYGVKRVDVIGGVRGNMFVGNAVFEQRDWETEDAVDDDKRKMENFAMNPVAESSSCLY